MSPLFEGMFFSDGKNDQSANGTGSLYEETVITGSTACRANCWYCIYSEVDFSGSCSVEATNVVPVKDRKKGLLFHAKFFFSL